MRGKLGLSLTMSAFDQYRFSLIGVAMHATAIDCGTLPQVESHAMCATGIHAQHGQDLTPGAGCDLRINARSHNRESELS